MRGIVGLFFSFLFFSLVHPSIFIDYCRVDCSLWACSSGDQMMLIVPLLLLVPPSLPFLCHGSFRFWPLEVTIYWNDTFWTPFFPPDVFFLHFWYIYLFLSYSKICSSSDWTPKWPVFNLQSYWYIRNEGVIRSIYSIREGHAFNNAAPIRYTFVPRIF